MGVCTGLETSRSSIETLWKNHLDLRNIRLIMPLASSGVPRHHLLEDRFGQCSCLRVMLTVALLRRTPVATFRRGRCRQRSWQKRGSRLRGTGVELVHGSTEPDCHNTDAYPFSEPHFLLLRCPLLDSEADRSRTNHLMRRRGCCGARTTAAAPAAADSKDRGSQQNQP